MFHFWSSILYSAHAGQGMILLIIHKLGAGCGTFDTCRSVSNHLYEWHPRKSSSHASPFLRIRATTYNTTHVLLLLLLYFGGCANNETHPQQAYNNQGRGACYMLLFITASATPPSLPILFNNFLHSNNLLFYFFFNE